MESGKGLEVAPGVAADGAEGIRLVLERRPDVVFVDGESSPVDLLAVTDQIVQGSAETGVVMFAVLPDDEFGLLALKAGAVGFCPRASGRRP